MHQIEAVEHAYDQLLLECKDRVHDYVEEQRALLRQHRIHTEDFHLPLRPIFFSAAQFSHLEHCVQVFWGGLVKTFLVAFGADLQRIAEFLHLPEPVQACLEQYFVPEREFAQLFGRPDGFVWGTNVRFIEQNITSGPGGIASTHILSRFFDGFPAIRALQEQLTMQGRSPIDAYAAFFGSPPLAGKRIGYIDALDPTTGGLWDDDGLRFLQTLADQGIQLINLTGRACTLRDDGVYVDDQRLDYVYRGVAAIGLWFRLAELAPLFQACGRGLLKMITSPFEIVFFDKMLLPYLSDPQLNTFLTIEERTLLAETVPWTRFLWEYTTTHNGATVHIPAFCRLKKNELVLKKGNSFGSEAVVMGVECTDAQWEEHLDTGLSEGTWVVQEVVTPPRVRLPYLDRGELVWADALSMTCPYIIQGKIGGVVGRTSIPGGGRVLVGAGVEGSQAGIRTAYCLI